MPSAASRLSTRVWAWVQSPFASHQRASSGTVRPAGGISAESEARNSVVVMRLLYHSYRDWEKQKPFKSRTTNLVARKRQLASPQVAGAQAPVGPTAGGGLGKAK